MVKKIFINLILLSVLTLAILAALKVVSQIYVTLVLKKGKLYSPDSICGWKLLPHLDIKRTNSEGGIWRIITNEDGIRGNAAWDPWCVLMGYVDDATSRIYANFYDYGGTKPAMDSFKGYIKRYGIPQSVYLDKHSTPIARLKNLPWRMSLTTKRP